MPETRSYKVKQVREVEVMANTMVDAISIADAAFQDGQNSDYGVKKAPFGVWGNTTSRIEETNMDCVRLR